MTALRRQCRAGSTDIIIACSIVAEAVGRGSETVAIGLLRCVTSQNGERVNTVEYIAISRCVFRLPGVGLRLSDRGIAAVGNTARGI